MKRRRKRKAEDNIETAIIILSCIALIVIIATVVLQVKQEQQEAKIKAEPEPLVITIPEQEIKGTITVYDYEGNCIYGYYGEIQIENDGRDGKDISVTCKGYLEGYTEIQEK